MVSGWERKNSRMPEQPGVNHGSPGGPPKKTAVSNVRTNTARTNSAETVTVDTATGGVTEVVRRMLLERSIVGTVTPDADLREIGLTSLDMVDLVLSVECPFDLQIPEAQIPPANFRPLPPTAPLPPTL